MDRRMRLKEAAFADINDVSPLVRETIGHIILKD